MPSVYLRHLHSKYYVKSLLTADCVPESQQEEFNKWRSLALSTTLARTTFNWTWRTRELCPTLDALTMMHDIGLAQC